MQGAMAPRGGQKVGRAQTERGSAEQWDPLGREAGGWGSQGKRAHTCQPRSRQWGRVPPAPWWLADPLTVQPRLLAHFSRCCFSPERRQGGSFGYEEAFMLE